MFDSLVSFTKKLFNDDQDEEPREPRQLVRPPRMMPPVERREPDTFKFIEPRNLWLKEDLHLVLTPKKIQQCYDERFRKGLQKYGGGVNYKQPNIEAIRQYMIDMRDLYLIIISQKKNARNLKDELDRLSAEFFKDYYPLLTKHMDVEGSTILVLKEVFEGLPRSFKTRDDSQLNDLMYKFYTYEKIVVVKMTENRLQDNESFKRTCQKIDGLHWDASQYYEKVVALRSAVLKTKQSCSVMSDQIIKKFSRKMKAQKILYILEKIKSKYHKVIDYCGKDLSDTSILAYGSLYRMFLISLVNFKSDAQKYSSLKVFKKLDDIITKKLISIKKRVKHQTYSELKTLVANPRARRTEILDILVRVHDSISKTSKEVLGKSKLEGKLPAGLELFDDDNLMETHYADLIAYNPTLDNERTRELLFGGASAGTGESRGGISGLSTPFTEKRPLVRNMAKPMGDR